MMKFTLLCGSLRQDSLNRKLMHVIESLLKTNNLGEVAIADLKVLALPVYDGDIEKEGLPSGVTKLANLIAQSDALICISPEYNGSIAGPFKNAIDWASRVRPIPFEAKPVLLTGASPGGFGAMRALAHSRAPFEALSAFVYPQSFALARAHEAFGVDGKLLDESMAKRLGELLINFTTFAERF